ncbi:MAG: Asp-tRNA(Asn)/Glu-tRNA(Gln) amidotransferase subunit GatA [Myxococcota bacterium]|nr:Asp-tRNA(Asn)/Glu-tRNA(Gln) amidotransferase subunit GatA [Myxococcota bacterium]
MDDEGTTSRDLVQAALDRIDLIDDGMNAWLHVDAEGALAAADEIDSRRAAGHPVGPLAGLPVGVKDMICTRGLPTTAASKMLEGFVPPYDATVVTRLREADAIILGKLNMDEFAMGSSNEQSAFGPVRNPWDPSRVPGGSSGGSAAAVAAATCALALGTDTGGSIRQPASLCGVVGVKPTYGRVSRFGAIAFASSLDQVGPLARTVEDAALLLDVLAGHDPRDSTSIPQAAPATLDTLADPVQGLRVGVPSEYFAEGLEPDVADRIRAALSALKAQGCELVELSLPHTKYAVPAYYIVATAEASSNLARYDGVAFGHRTAESGPLDAMIARSRAEGFGPEVTRRLLLGTYALSSGYYDAYYLKAQKVRTLVRQDFARAFERCDVIAGPTSPVSAVPLGARTADPLQMYLMDVYTIPANLAGLPCASVPCGFDAAGLPVGLQLIGRPMDEATMLRVAYAYEAAHTWCEASPDLGELVAAGPAS